jgi:hypothetical protein
MLFAEGGLENVSLDEIAFEVAAVCDREAFQNRREHRPAHYPNQ